MSISPLEATTDIREQIEAIEDKYTRRNIRISEDGKSFKEQLEEQSNNSLYALWDFMRIQTELLVEIREALIDLSTRPRE
jgi:hypothetical protein